jgi:hypothetical protein
LPVGASGSRSPTPISGIVIYQGRAVAGTAPCPILAKGSAP